MPLSTASDFFDSSSTSLVAPYDEVTVVSQRSLNALLQKAFDEIPALHKVGFKAPAEGGDDKDADTFSGFDAVFDAPKIELQLSTESKPLMVIYTNAN